MARRANKEERGLQEQAADILKMAEESGTECNYFFRTTFERYQTQIAILSKLKSQMNEEEVLVTKEYVKGRKNLYTNPAITEYNKTTDSANKTVAILLKIIASFGAKKEDAGEDPLVKIINGDG